ncbi:NACHT and WD repeat domain-containing protein 2-like [Mixophyes fleayi]|uniref:NACHT and WD repeat domain-containing protein 2-like n=1 Tax=Mixophyes fleayi TaxID=3061075 RepID=UPI003F4D84A8
MSFSDYRRQLTCSDKKDSERERAALRTDVYPKLREYCRHVHGLEIQVLDGYDGIHPDDFYSGKVRRIRRQLLEECLRSSAGPWFVALIGEEYGKSCLPTLIGCEEFENILSTAEELRVCTKVLQTWYHRDENAIPPLYTLLDEEEVSLCTTGQQPVTSDMLVYESASELYFSTGNPGRMYEASREIRDIFATVVPLCVQKRILGDKQAQKYFTSGLEDELLFALENQSEDVLSRCVFYIHKVPYKVIQKHRGKAEQSEGVISDGYARLCHLRDTLIPALACTEGLCVYSTTTTCDIKVGYTKEKKQQYVEGLCGQFYSDMVKLVDHRTRRYPAPLRNGSEEVLQHLSLCTMYSNLQQYEFTKMESIKSYVLHDESRKPMVIFGEPCCGKTVLLASCAKKVRLWLKDFDPVLVVRFVPPVGEPLTLRRLITGLCQQLANIFNIQIPAHEDDIAVLAQCFIRLLSAPTKQRPLVLILDAVDNLTCFERDGETFWWLPSPLPQFTKIILSTTRETFADQNRSWQSDQVILLELKPTRKECNDHLKMNLLKEQRKITSGQLVYVNRSLGKSTSPLQILLLYKEVTGWKSYRDVDDRPTEESIYQSIERLFHALENHYGYEFIFRALSYITLSRSGLGEAELVDVLSADDMVLAQLYHVHDIKDMLRVPDWLVANILFDLKGCIAHRVVTGCSLITWTHRLYQQVVTKRYLKSQEVIHKLHSNLCSYFSGRWASGRPKLISIKPNHGPQHDKQSNSETTECNPLAKIYIDRRLPSQPWSFTGHLGTQTRVIRNVRKALDLPYHLKECGNLDTLYTDVLMVLPYYKTLLKSGHLNSLIHSIEDAAILMEREEVHLIYNMLKETRCLLNDNPDAFEMIVQSKLMPLVSIYPCLLRFAKQTYFESIKNSSLVVLNSAVFKLPVNIIEIQEPSNIVSILEMKTKHQLIVVFQCGFVYSWSRTKKLNLEYQLSNGTEIISATLENEGRYIALSTSKRSILLLDCSSWTLLNEITDTNQEAKFMLKGYHLSNEMLCVCFENTPIVKIFNVLSGEILKEATFAEKITYFGYVDSGKYTILGQRNKLIIYNTEFLAKKTVLQMHNLKHIIRDVYIHEYVVYIIDKSGAITVWDIEDLSEPQLMDEIYPPDKYDEVISTEYCPGRLLICRSTTFDVWETLTWQKDTFSVPHEGKFISCVFSYSGEEIIGAVENVPSLLVWGLKSGQCISMVNLESETLTLLTKSLQLNLLQAITKNKSIMMWDLESVISPRAYSQTGRPVRSLLLYPLGSHAYSSDGSDMVCKWDIPSCRITALYQHRGFVEIAKVTSNGELLVTSVTSGELYVWETETGTNTHRIHSGSVSQLLMIPKSNFVVILCEDGVSRVWKPKTATTVCEIHTPLSQACITPEGTFVIGMNDNRLLAVSLWSGYVSKQFRCSDDSGSIVAFQCLSSHPDFIVLMTSNQDVYTWNVVEETLCHHTKLPVQLPLLRSLIQVSSNGDVIIITVGGTVNVISMLDRKLCVLHEHSDILYQHLTKDGRYLIYVCQGRVSHCGCDFHVNPVLHLMEVLSGEKIGQCHLGKVPCAMTVSDDDSTVCVGFEDGTLGLYSIAMKCKGNKEIETFLTLRNKKESIDVPVKIYQGKLSGEILWNDLTSAGSSLDCSFDKETVLEE